MLKYSIYAVSFASIIAGMGACKNAKNSEVKGVKHEFNGKCEVRTSSTDVYAMPENYNFDVGFIQLKDGTFDYKADIAVKKIDTINNKLDGDFVDCAGETVYLKNDGIAKAAFPNVKSDIITLHEVKYTTAAGANKKGFVLDSAVFPAMAQDSEKLKYQGECSVWNGNESRLTGFEDVAFGNEEVMLKGKSWIIGANGKDGNRSAFVRCLGQARQSAPSGQSGYVSSFIKIEAELATGAKQMMWVNANSIKAERITENVFDLTKYKGSCYAISFPQETHETRTRGYEKILADASALKASKTWIIGEDTPGVLLNCLGESQRGPMADDPMHL
ncbi:MAG: hypothetical protein NTX25_07770, partial [Proteobacteria bacterium]|nr:hypothetical protein [Pseudomonadota bacterium]